MPGKQQEQKCQQGARAPESTATATALAGFCQKPRLTCSLVAVQTDKLYRAFMRGPAAFALSHVLSSWAVTERIAIAC